MRDRNGAFPAERVFTSAIWSLTADPLGTVSSLYRHFGMELADEARVRIAALIAARPNGGYGQNEYRIEDFGVEPGRVEERVRGYTEHFGIVRSATGARRSP